MTSPNSSTDVGERRESSAPYWTIWLVAFAIVLALVLAVVRFLSLPGDSSGHEMVGMQHDGSAGALLRLGSAGVSSPLLGWALVTRWQLDSIAVAFVVLLGAAYLTGLVKVRRSQPWPVGRTVSFFAGLGICIYATCGGPGVYDMALFSAHMIGHLAFVMVAPALLMTGRPIELALQASTPSRRDWLLSVLHGRVWTVFTAPPVALASYAVVIVGSHLTGLMDTIMSNPWAGQIEHLVYLIIGCQFFLLVLGDTPGRWQLSTPARWLMLALSMAVDTFVGVVIMMSNTPVSMTVVNGLTVNPLADTHTGGSIMWFGGDGIMAAIMIIMVLGWLNDPARQRRDNSGWIEQARRVTFAERTGMDAAHTSEVADDLTFDDEDARLTAYNAWLTKINSEP
ncbi:cytochrome c oxidase assembly protein [Jatrophihabitans sp. DSM 45814]